VTLFAYIARRFLAAFAAVFSGVTLVVLIVDFADRARTYRGEGAGAALLELYALKAVEAGWLVAPTALIIAAAVVVSTLQQRNETVAMAALGYAPRAVVGPVAAVAAGVGLVLWVAGDLWVAPAARRAERIVAERFEPYAEWAAPGAGRWVRGERRFYHLGESEGGAFARVTVLEPAPGAPFRVARRIDAARMEPLGGGEWKLRDAAVREFGDAGGLTFRREAELRQRFAEEPAAFRLRGGRPAQLSAEELREQVDLRRRMGLPTRPWEVALHEKLALPAAAVPAAALGAVLALRRRRRAGLSLALAEGIVVTVVLAAAHQVARTLALSGAAPAVAAAWAPFALLVALAFGARLWR
jgi:lipopolysaccharide export system permease protein